MGGPAGWGKRPQSGPRGEVRGAEAGRDKGLWEVGQPGRGQQYRPGGETTGG